MTGSGAATAKTFERLEQLSPQLRQCVHEYGLPIVEACLQAGVKDPRRIHNLVKEIWNGARQKGQRNTNRHKRCAVQDTLDWALIQSGSEMSAETFVRILWEHSLVIVPREPTLAMIEASKATVSNYDLKITKSDKHRLRLRAALDAAVLSLWPSVIRESYSGAQLRLKGVIAKYFPNEASP